MAELRFADVAVPVAVGKVWGKSLHDSVGTGAADPGPRLVGDSRGDLGQDGQCRPFLVHVVPAITGEL